MNANPWRPALLALLGLLAPLATFAADPAGKDPELTSAEYVRRNYSKFEFRVPMRDGAKLFTVVYVPNDTSRTWPFLLFRTPYSIRPYGADRYRESLGPNERFQEEGFIFVYQDVRGRYMSEGEFVNMRPHLRDKKGPGDVDESTDTWDTIDWLLENIPNHNGKAGLWGISYPGFYSTAGMIDSHPALAAVSPQAPIADWFWDDMHHHGAFILPVAFNFFSSFGVPRKGLTTESVDGFEHPTADGYQFFLDLGPLKNVNERHFKGEIPFWNELTRHPNYDEFWQSRNILPHLENISAAVMVVGGWYDTEDLYGPLNIYRTVEEKNPGIFNTLVMGPWVHGGWNHSDGDALGMVDFGYRTSEYFQAEVELPFFVHHLKGEGELHLPEALIFETGANRWRRFDAWPPPSLERRTLYLAAGGRLAWEPPEAELDAHDLYRSDPAKPVPYTMEITTRWARKYMTEDQRFAAWRPDVLVYQSEILEDDLTLAGDLVAELWVALEGDAERLDADWVVKVIDVFPSELPSDEDDEGTDERPSELRGANPLEDLGGLQRLVRAEVLRGRFRNDFTSPEPFVPGEPARVAVKLHDLLHTFQRGHRIMVQIQSTWFPFIDRNPGKWVPNIFEASDEDFIPTLHRVYRSPQRPSGLRVGVLPGGKGAPRL